MGGKRVSDEILLEALLSTKSIKDASVKTGLTVQSVYNRLNNPVFRAKLQKHRTANFNVASNKLTTATGDAIETLIEIMNDYNVASAVRVKSAQALLDITLRVHEQVDILARVEEIENILKESK